MIELLQIFVDNIAPILIVAGLGFVVGRAFGMEPRFLGQLIFNLFSPALAFNLLYTSEVQPGELLALFTGTIVFQIVIVLLTFGVMRWRQIPRIDAATVMMSSFCLNAGNYGLPLVSFAYGSEVLMRAVIVFVSNLVLNYTVGVFVASSGRKSLRDSLMGILKVPTVYAIPAAFILRAFTPELPPVLMRPVQLLSDATIPCMLVLLGLQLSQSTRLVKLSLVGTGVVIKMLIAPFIGVILALILNLNPLARVAFITQVSMPTAVMTLVFATEYGLDLELSMSLIMATTLFSPLPLSLIIWLLRPTVGI